MHDVSRGYILISTVEATDRYNWNHDDGNLLWAVP